MRVVYANSRLFGVVNTTNNSAPTETKSHFGCSTSGVSIDFPLTKQIITGFSNIGQDNLIHGGSSKRFTTISISC